VAVLALDHDPVNNTVELFVNGVSQGSQSYNVDYPATTPMVIGGPGDFFGGRLSHVTVWNRALTAREHRRLVKTALAGVWG
jgi:hypothetical protein